jgi:hypothetical protein
MPHAQVFGQLLTLPAPPAGGGKGHASGGTKPAPPATGTSNTEAQLEAQQRGFAHAMRCPPHGPFAYLAAGALSDAAHRGKARWPSDAAAPAPGVAGPPTPAQSLSFFAAAWNLDHLRVYAKFYAPAEVRLEDIDAL